MTFHLLCSSEMEIFQYFGFYANVNFHIHDQMHDVIRGRTAVSPWLCAQVYTTFFFIFLSKFRFLLVYRVKQLLWTIALTNISSKPSWRVILKKWFLYYFTCSSDKECLVWQKQNSALSHVLMKWFSKNWKTTSFLLLPTKTSI